MATTNGWHPVQHEPPTAKQPTKLIIDTDPGCGALCAVIEYKNKPTWLHSCCIVLLDVVDPHTDDAMAILAAFNSPEIDILGLTTLYGNVQTPQATLNALTLVEMAGASTPVATGASHSLTTACPPHIADFVVWCFHGGLLWEVFSCIACFISYVFSSLFLSLPQQHGADGFGNTNLALPTVCVSHSLACTHYHHYYSTIPPLSSSQGQPITQSAADFIVDQVNANPGEVVILALAALTNIALALKKDPTISHKWVCVYV